MTTIEFSSSAYTPIGWVNGTPVYPLGGGRGSGIEFAVGDDDKDPEFDDERNDDDDQDDDDQDDDDQDDDGEPAPRARQRRGQQDDGEWAPPSREQFERMETALKRANQTAARHRRAGKFLDRLGIDDLPTWVADRGIDPETGSPFVGDDPVDPDDESTGDEYQEEPREQRGASNREVTRKVRAAEQRGAQRVRDELFPILAQQSAEAAMREAGFSGDRRQLDRMLRTIDARQLDVEMDADGFEIVGLDEQIEELKDTFPQYFHSGGDEEAAPRARGQREERAPARRRKTGAAAVDGGDRGRSARKPQGWAEQMVAQLEGRGRR